MRWLFLATALISIFASAPAQAFEWATHGAITTRAWNRMIGMDENKLLLIDLGLPQSAADPFVTSIYFDIDSTRATSAIRSSCRSPTLSPSRDGFLSPPLRISSRDSTRGWRS
jgi:hypothetical protein